MLRLVDPERADVVVGDAAPGDELLDFVAIFDCRKIALDGLEKMLDVVVVRNEILQVGAKNVSFFVFWKFAETHRAFDGLFPVDIGRNAALENESVGSDVRCFMLVGDSDSC